MAFLISFVSVKSLLNLLILWMKTTRASLFVIPAFGRLYFDNFTFNYSSWIWWFVSSVNSNKVDQQNNQARNNDKNNEIQCQSINQSIFYLAWSVRLA